MTNTSAAIPAIKKAANLTPKVVLYRGIYKATQVLPIIIYGITWGTLCGLGACVASGFIILGILGFYHLYLAAFTGFIMGPDDVGVMLCGLIADLFMAVAGYMSFDHWYRWGGQALIAKKMRDINHHIKTQAKIDE